MYVNRITHLTETQMKDVFRRAQGRRCQLPCSKHCRANPALLPVIVVYSFLLHISVTGEYCCWDASLFWALVPSIYLGSVAGPQKKMLLCQSRSPVYG